MKEYHKIQTVFKRDPITKYKTLLFGEYSIPEFEYLQNNIWQFTEKVDGTNIRIGIKDKQLVIKGRTDNAQIPTFLLATLMNMFDPNKLMDIFEENTDVCLYGEGYGAKIQKGGGNYKSNGTDFVLFDVRINEWWLKNEDVNSIANQLGIGVVPTIGCGTLADMVEMARQGITSKWGNFPAEGIVARPSIELATRSGHRIITKIKTKDFRGETT